MKRVGDAPTTKLTARVCASAFPGRTDIQAHKLEGQLRAKLSRRMPKFEWLPLRPTWSLSVVRALGAY